MSVFIFFDNTCFDVINYQPHLTINSCSIAYISILILLLFNMFGSGQYADTYRVHATPIPHPCLHGFRANLGICLVEVAVERFNGGMLYTCCHTLLMPQPIDGDIYYRTIEVAYTVIG